MRPFSPTHHRQLCLATRTCRGLARVSVDFSKFDQHATTGTKITCLCRALCIPGSLPMTRDAAYVLM